MKHLIYYGLTKNQYDNCKQEILYDNRRCLVAIGQVTSVIGLLLFLLAVFAIPTPKAVPVYAFIFIFYGIESQSAYFRKDLKGIQALVYITIAVTYLLCIYLATCVTVPTENGVTALFIFTACGLLAIIRMDTYLILLVCFYIVFFALSWKNKMPFVATADTINGFIFALIGVVLNYQIVSLKLRSYLDQKRLLSEIDQLHELVENVPGGFAIFTFDNHRLIPQIINSGIAKIYSIDKQEMLNRIPNGIEQFIHPDDYANCRQGLYDALYGNGRFNMIYRLPKKNSSEAVYIHAQGKILTKNNEEQIVYVNFTDISDQLLIEKNKRENAAKSDFLSKMSHDLRTPMNVIIGMSDLALENKNAPEKVEDYLRKINSSSHYLLGLVNDVLDMSKIESNRLMLSEEPYPYEDFVQDITTIVAPLCEKKHIRFLYDTKPTGCTILADKVRLRQIYFNLLSNAVKFTPEHGQVEFKITNIHITEDSFSSDNYVIDNGIGMSSKFQTHMFEPFIQENSDHLYNSQGTGLGLAIVHNLVTLMGGTITVDSQQGRGTSIMVHLEFKRAKAENTAAQLLSNSVDLNGRRVLLAEDNELNTEIAAAIMKKLGLEVFCAANGKIAVDMFSASDEGYYDVILMDIMMPEMDGYEAAHTIRHLDRKDSQTIPIIALSANAFAEDIEKSKRMGMNNHLIKPINPQILLQALRSVLSDTL